MVEQRRSHRSPLAIAVEVRKKGADASFAAQARDCSVGGMFIETASPFPFGTEVLVTASLPGSREALVFPAVVRWTRQDGMGVQFQLLGAKETHAITEVVKSARTA